MRLAAPRAPRWTVPVDEVIARFETALEGRAVRERGVRVLWLTERRAAGLRAIPRGSIAVFVAPRSSDVLDVVAGACRAQAYGPIEALVGRHESSIARHALVGRSRFRAYEEVPVFGELRYGDTSLAHGFFLDGGRELAFARLPFDGGELHADHFRFLEHRRPDAGDELECLLVIRLPVLTSLERHVLARVPGELTEHDVGPSRIYYAIVAATVGVFAIAATIVATYLVYREMMRERERQQACAQGAGGAEPSPTPCPTTPEGQPGTFDLNGSARALLQRRVQFLTAR